MNNWKPRQYLLTGQTLGIPDEVLKAAIQSANQVISVNPALPPVFSLKHLAELSQVDYGLLRQLVSRSITDSYRTFKIRKRSKKLSFKSYRTICVPSPELMKVQQWICKRILNIAKDNLHPASTAYAPKSDIVKATEIHCGAKWLIKMDLKNFFESISEISAYKAFLSLGYQPLISFEMARLCTRLGPYTSRRKHEQWINFNRYSIGDYRNFRIGHLPQGAPTSPMLANMAMIEVDSEIEKLATNFGFTYSRYADDLTFSQTNKEFSDEARSFIGKVYQIIGTFGLSPNAAKTKVVSLGARKVVLGLLVDKKVPSLTREFKMKMRMHLYYLKHKNIGPIHHAKNRGFSAVTGLKNHVFGLAYYAYQVDKNYGSGLLKELKMIDWPV